MKAVVQWSFICQFWLLRDWITLISKRNSITGTFHHFILIAISVQECEGPLITCDSLMSGLDYAWTSLQAECGLELTSNMKQCLKVVIARFLTHQNHYSLSVLHQDGVSWKLNKSLYQKIFVCKSRCIENHWNCQYYKFSITVTWL